MVELALIILILCAFWGAVFWRLRKTPKAPDICDRIIYHGRRYRVTGWLKKVPKNSLMKTEFFHGAETISGEESFNDIIDDILVESSHDYEDGYRLMWCEREEATHVSGAGVAGCTAPIGECEVTGKVEWSEEMITQEKESQKRRIGTIVW